MIMNDRLIYSGRAVVSTLVNTGILLVCECTLEESWLDVDLFTSIHHKDKLQNEFAEFLKEWEKVQKVNNDLKVVIADMQTFMMDLRRWLEQVEMGIRSDPAGDRLQTEREVIMELKDPILPTVNALFERFEQNSNSIPQELQSLHRAYSRRQMHPIVLCSPFVYRTFQKPLGYAGDYEMVNMMLRDPLEGSSLFAKIVNLWFVNAPPCEAHRNRIKHLTLKLNEETQRVSREKRPLRVLDMACGPAKEIQNFLIQDDLCEKAEFTLYDFNDETLEYTGKTLTELKRLHHRGTPITMVKRSVNHILKETFKPADRPRESEYDFIYVAGLFDYLEDRICKKLMDYFYGLLAPGGLLLATNVTPSNPIINIMESLVEWHLIYRDQAQMETLKPESAPEGSCEIKTEATGINIFLEVRKPK
jgi:extracellular factor (EF) 3-hydroxypalmitic acid methyl ester biosynthesis protein